MAIQATVTMRNGIQSLNYLRGNGDLIQPERWSIRIDVL